MKTPPAVNLPVDLRKLRFVRDLEKQSRKFIFYTPSKIAMEHILSNFSEDF